MGDMVVLGREAVDDRNNVQQNYTARQQMYADAEYKAHQAESYALQAKAQAKQADTEEKKYELDKSANLAKLMSDSYKMAVNFATEKAPNNSYTINPQKYQKAMQNLLGSAMAKYPEMIGMLDELSKSSPTTLSGEEQKDFAAARFMNASAEDLAGTGGGSSGAAPEGDIMSTSRNRILTGRTFGPTGATSSYAYPEAESQVNRAKAIGTLQGEKAEGKTISDQDVGNLTDIQNGLDGLTASLDAALSNPRFAAKMGPFGGPARAVAGLVDPEFRGFQSVARDVFSQYRKIITGAQASKQELDWLETILGKVEDTYDTFLVKNYIHARLAQKRLSNRIHTLGVSGRDTRGFEETQGAIGAQLEKVQTAIQKRGLDVNTLIGSLKLPEKDTVIAKGMARGLTYEQSLAAYYKFKRQ